MDLVNAMLGTSGMAQPAGCRPISCKWVFKKKLRPNGTIEKYKGRLVAKGFIQKEDEDFFDTYSLVARLTIICAIILGCFP